MKRLFERWIIKQFLRITPNVEYFLKDKERERMQKWLADSHGTDKMKAYFIMRDYALMKELGTKQDRERYLILVGRRLELLHLIGEARNQYDKIHREKPVNVETKKK